MIDARTEAVVARLRVLPGPAERIAALADRARRLPALRVEERVEANLVRGCVSRVWLVGGSVDGRMWFRADADSVMVAGLLTLAWEMVEGLPWKDVAAAPEEPPFVMSLGLVAQISPTRLHGLGQLWRRMRALASKSVRFGCWQRRLALVRNLRP